VNPAEVNKDPQPMKLAFCGTGLMGAPMAQRLIQAGHQLNVWNRSAAKTAVLTALGAIRCETPAQAVRDVDGVIICLLDTKAVEDVVFGGQGLAQTAGWNWLIDHSSMDPQATRTFGERLRQTHGAQWLDAPVSGGVAGAQSGTLSIMAGGDAALFERLSPLMAAYAARLTHMGPTGAGQTAKLCNQTIVSATLAAVAEALALARAAGIAADRLPQALGGGWADSKPLQIFAPRMLQTPADTIGAVTTMLKDVDTVLAQAKAMNVPMPVAAVVQQALRQTVAMGLGQADMSAVVCVSQPDRINDYQQTLLS